MGRWNCDSSTSSWPRILSTHARVTQPAESGLAAVDHPETRPHLTFWTAFFCHRALTKVNICLLRQGQRRDGKRPDMSVVSHSLSDSICTKEYGVEDVEHYSQLRGLGISYTYTRSTPSTVLYLSGLRQDHVSRVYRAVSAAQSQAALTLAIYRA